MAIKIDVDKQKLGKSFGRRSNKMSERCIKALQGSAYVVAERIETRGRNNMRRAGNFGSARWQEGFRALVSYRSRTNIRIRITHAVSYWRVFQHGARIRGNPLLWIPLDFAADAKGILARNYPGRLFRVDRQGKAPLLLTDGGKPKYFGKESVRIPKKFRLIEISREVFRSLPAIYRGIMKRGGK